MSFFSKLNQLGRTVVSAAKQVAARVIDFMANDAEKLIGKVKQVWSKVKPFVERMQAPLRTMAAATDSVPILGKIIRVVAIGVETLLALENSPVLKGVEKAILYAARKAKEIETSIKNGELSVLITPQEYEEALGNRRQFRAMEREADTFDQDVRYKFDIASAINDLGIAEYEVEKAILGEPEDFQHYLRLRAAQKLLRILRTKLVVAGTIDGLLEEDWFLVRVASDLVKANPELQSDTALRFDEILRSRTGKNLQSFIFEELIAAWKYEAKTLATSVQDETRLIASKTVARNRLRLALKDQGELSSEEAKELALLEAEVPKLDETLKELNTRKNDVCRYADASEGYLQMLEKTEAELEAEDRSYVFEEGEQVGRIIMEAAQNGTPFAKLSHEDQSLVSDFANVFYKDAEQRMATVLEITA